MLNDEAERIRKATIESLHPLACFRLSNGLLRMYPANSTSAENLIRSAPHSWLGTFTKRTPVEDIREDLEHHCWTVAA